MTPDRDSRTPDAHSSLWKKAGGWTLWAIAGLLAFSVVSALLNDSEAVDDTDRTYADRPYVAGPLDVARAELEMSHYCEGDLSPLESAARWILVEEVSTADWTAEDYAVFIVLLEGLCGVWQAEGNAAIARVIYAEGGIESHLATIDKATYRARVAAVTEQLEKLGDIDTIRLLMRIGQ